MHDSSLTALCGVRSKVNQPLRKRIQKILDKSGIQGVSRIYTVLSYQGRLLVNSDTSVLLNNLTSADLGLYHVEVKLSNETTEEFSVSLVIGGENRNSWKDRMSDGEIKKVYGSPSLFLTS